MDRSFRSSPPILQLVDRVVADIGHEALGLPRRPNPHASFHEHRPGSVTLWEPWTEETRGEEDAGEEGWISDTTRRYAACLARQIKAWIDQPFALGQGAKRRPVRPEDILILVRRRGPWPRFSSHVSMPREFRWPALTGCSCPRRWPCRIFWRPLALPCSRSTTST
jgi:ATP-dependent helicase/nuclease subunit A